MSNSKWKPLVFVMAMLLTILGIFFYDSPEVLANEPASEGQVNVVKLGAILPLTGELSSKGEQVRTALALSVESVNTYLAETKKDFRFTIDFRDSQGMPDKALNQAESLYEEGITILVAGSSAEVEAIKPWSDMNDVIVLSYSSSAPSLGVPNDSVFRVVPDDYHQVSALATLLADQGMELVIPVYRNDIYGREMVEMFVQQFQGDVSTSVVVDAISYEPQTRDFADVIQSIEASLKASTAPKEKTAILLIAFEEANQIFESAEQLSEIRWYGTETLTLNTSFSNSPVALEFIEKVGFTGVSYGLLETSYYYKVKEAIEAEVQHYVMPNAIYAYDIPWLLASVLPQLEDPSDTNELKDRFIELSESFIGATGWVVLNDAGDRKYADFNIWQIQTDGEDSYWVLIGTYLRNPGYPGYIDWAPGYAPEQALEMAYLLGFQQSSYNPLSYVYRDEFVYMLMHTLYNGALENMEALHLSYSDANLIDQRALDSVQLAVQNGVLLGYGDQTLGPHHLITRAEMLTMVGRALGMVLPEGTMDNTEFYSDTSQIPEWAIEHVMKLTQHGLLSFEKGDLLGPAEYITLAEATEMCLRIIQYTK